MKKSIEILPEHLKIVRDILRRYLPPQATVWVFGSRATHTAKKFSDLDLLVDIGEPLSIELIADLANDFDESDLPYKVDVVDWNTISESFRERIQADRVVIWERKSKK